MEKEIFFLFDPDASEIVLEKKDKYSSALPRPAAAKQLPKKTASLKLNAAISKVFCTAWWN